MARFASRPMAKVPIPVIASPVEVPVHLVVAAVFKTVGP